MERKQFGDLTFLVRGGMYDSQIINEDIKYGYMIPNDARMVIDIGAHIGSTAILAAKKGSFVIAFEPDLENFSMLRDNIIINNVGSRVLCVNKAVGVPSKRMLYKHKTNSGCYSLDKNNASTKMYESCMVDVVSLESIFKEYSIDACDVLKLDCEGAEFDILINLDDIYFKNIKQISLEIHEHHGRAMYAALLKKLRRLYNTEFIIRKHNYVFSE